MKPFEAEELESSGRGNALATEASYLVSQLTGSQTGLYLDLTPSTSVLAQSEKELKDMVLANLHPSQRRKLRQAAVAATTSQVVTKRRRSAARKHQKELVAQFRDQSGKKSVKAMLADVVPQSSKGKQERPSRKKKPSLKLKPTAKDKPSFAKKVSQKSFRKEQARHAAACSCRKAGREGHAGWSLDWEGGQSGGSRLPGSAQWGGGEVWPPERWHGAGGGRRWQVRVGLGGSSHNRCAGEAVSRQLGLHRSGC